MAARVIAVLQPKGGAGKTTLSTNLAAAMHRRGLAVTLVDTDTQGTARDWAASAADDAPLVLGVDRAPALRRTVATLAADADCIIIDGSARVDGMDAEALKVAHLVLIPITPSNADIWGAQPVVDLVSARQSVTDGQPAAAYVVSRQVAGSNLAREVGDALDGFPVLQARTSQRVAYAEALSSGGAVVLGPDKKAAAEIDALTDEILTLLSPSS
jgi:chromosome partitioning protein